MPSPKKTYSDVQMAFQTGRVMEASQGDLEQFLLAIAETQVHSDMNRARTDHMGSTIRLLLTVKHSQDAQRRSTIISMVALVISVAALVCSVLQAYWAYDARHQAGAPQSSISQQESATPTPAPNSPAQSPK
jgi:hypothetical protein